MLGRLLPDLVGHFAAVASLRSGQIQALITWLPVEEPDLSVGAVAYTEPRVLAVPITRSPIAGQSRWRSLLTATGQPHVPDYREDAYNPFATRSGRPVDNRLYTASFEEILRLVSVGEMVHPLGAHAARYYRRPDVTYLALDDAPCLRWGLVWRSDNENPLVLDLARIFRELGLSAA